MDFKDLKFYLIILGIILTLIFFNLGPEIFNYGKASIEDIVDYDNLKEDQGIGIVNGEETYLKSQELKKLNDENEKYISNFLDNYEKILKNDGIEKRVLIDQLKKEEKNSHSDLVFNRIMERLIYQDTYKLSSVDDDFLDFFEDKDFLTPRELEKLVDRHKFLVLQREGNLEEDFNKFLEEQRDEIYLVDYQYKDFVSKTLAEKGMENLNNLNLESDTRLNLIYPTFRRDKYFQEESLIQGLKVANSNNSIQIISHGDSKIRYRVVKLNSYTNQGEEYREKVREFYEDMIYFNYLKELFFNSQIQIKVPITNFITPAKHKFYGKGTNLDRSSLEDKLLKEMKTSLKPVKEISIDDLYLEEDRTLLYVNNPIKKKANYRLTLKLKFEEVFNEENYLELGNKVNQRLYQSILDFEKENNLILDDYLHEIFIEFYDVEGNNLDYLNIGYTFIENEDFPTKEVVAGENKVIKLLNTHLKEALDDNYAIENFGPRENLYIQIFIGDEREEEYIRKANLAFEVVEAIREEEDFNKYLKELNIDKIKLNIISNWFDPIEYEF